MSWALTVCCSRLSASCRAPYSILTALRVGLCSSLVPEAEGHAAVRPWQAEGPAQAALLPRRGPVLAGTASLVGLAQTRRAGCAGPAGRPSDPITENGHHADPGPVQRWATGARHTRSLTTASHCSPDSTRARLVLGPESELLRPRNRSSPGGGHVGRRPNRDTECKGDAFTVRRHSQQTRGLSQSRRRPRGKQSSDTGRSGFC